LIFLSGLFSAILTIVSVLGLLTIVVGIVGAIVDGVTWNVIDHLRACYDPSIDTYYGNSRYFEDISGSCIDFSSSHSCLCVQTGRSHYCFAYDINHESQYDCGDVLDYYNDLLGASTGICVFIIFLGLFYVCMLFTAGCNNISRAQQHSYPQNFQQVPLPSGPGAWNNNTRGNSLVMMAAVPTADPELGHGESVTVVHGKVVGMRAPPFIPVDHSEAGLVGPAAIISHQPPPPPPPLAPQHDSESLASTTAPPTSDSESNIHSIQPAAVVSHEPRHDS
jgi:hypothetical protein